MSAELLPIVAPVLKAIAPEIGKKIARKINSLLNPTDLEKALKAGIKSSLFPAYANNFRNQTGLLYMVWY